MDRDQEYYRWTRDHGSSVSSQSVLAEELGYQMLLTPNRTSAGSSRTYDYSDRYSTASSRTYDSGSSYLRNYNRFRQDTSQVKSKSLHAFCEDEAASMAREYRPPPPVQDEIPFRGTVNQEPIIITLVNLERRFVLVSDPTNSLPKTVRNEQRSRKPDGTTKDIPSLRVETDGNKVPNRRKPTPYSFTPLEKTSTKEALLSPATLAPPSSTAMPRSVPNDSGIQQLKKHQRNKSSVSLDSQSTDGEDSDRIGSAKNPLERRKTRVDDTSPLDSAARDLKSSLPRVDRSTSRSSVNTNASLVDSLKYAASPRPSSPSSPKVGELGRNQKPFSKPDSRSNSPSASWDSDFAFDSDGPTSSFPIPKVAPSSRLAPTSIPNPARPEGSRKASGLPYPDDFPSRSSTLPYPEDDHPMIMPEEMHFQIASPTQTPRSHPQLSRTVSTTSQSSSRTIRPTQFRAVSANTIGQNIPREASFSQPSSSSTLSPPPPELPPCPRRSYVVGYNDWYTLEGCPDFDVCPSCLREIIMPSPFRRSFVPAQISSTASIRCDFGNPWVRCAWLLTLKEQRKDLTLIKDLYHVFRTQDRCTENKEGVRAWYGLKDDDGTFIPNFYICPRDKNSMEVLFPSLVGALSRRPTTNTPRVCAFRVESSRFHIYLDVLDAINDTAMKKVSSRSRVPVADISHFIDLAATLACMPECPRNRPFPNLNWHYMPAEPSITVCPECYDTVIGPDARRGVSLAASFVQTARPALSPSSTRPAALQPTCQLYSSRMRGIWDAAVEDMNPDFFLMRARERRIREMDIASNLAKMTSLLSDINRGDYPGTTMDRDRLRREILRLEQEWEKIE